MNGEPPNDTNAEQATLGSMLQSKDAIGVAAEVLKREYFYTPKNADIFDAIIHLSGIGLPVDAVTVASEMGKRGSMNTQDRAPYLITLMSSTPTPVNIASYAQVVYDKWRQRQIIDAGHRFVQLGYMEATSTDEVDALLGQADGLFRDLSQPSGTGLMWDQLVDKWRGWQKTDGGVVPMPWSELNSLLNGGGHAGQMIIVGGRPGAGKSLGGLNVALNAAELGHKTVVFSVEMDDVEVCSRLLAAGGWASQSQIMRRSMTLETHERVETYIYEHQGMDLELVDEASITVEAIVAHCRTRRPELIFVDYAQLITASNNRLVREQQVAHITRSLKIAAKQLQMVVVVAAQLNRGSVDRVPVISDLRESGAAEQDADVVLLLHAPADQPGITQVVCGKNRNGATGIVELVFRGEIARLG